ncbi:gamma-glutamyl-gamma-aminobutyrate hydrolase family protein [Azospirillum sp. B4]|uniref:gamma-glutamyl-gamma-aminobutyrate hydrolase family protein n=1 Tax=Azospirillum sp. B4 TaxID=95605 RepID=UPI00034978D9|nr:gamma-glutamyl-gamma-aminobutyrate hydrolase family protein [Azospirillum sp. B4]
MISQSRGQPRVGLPVVGVSCDYRTVGRHPFHVVGDKYVRAVSDGADALAVLLPALGDRYDAAEVVARLDGLLFTGSPSNVHPDRYDGPMSEPGTLHDVARDATTFPLFQAALAADLPIFAICRGLQELNVALGGTLHQKVQDVPGLMDHRDDESQPLEVQYGGAHAVDLTPGGLMAGITGRERMTVNSLHQQGIDRLAPSLAVEAVAPDGLIEAVRVEGATFALAVQWHPEWRYWEDPASVALFKAFGDAVRTRASRRG